MVVLESDIETRMYLRDSMKRAEHSIPFPWLYWGIVDSKQNKQFYLRNIYVSSNYIYILSQLININCPITLLTW